MKQWEFSGVLLFIHGNIGYRIVSYKCNIVDLLFNILQRIMLVTSPKLQPAQGRILTTDTCSPLQRFSPASHSLIVWFPPSSPTRTHTFIPGLEQSAESRQLHSLVWSKKKKVHVKVHDLSFILEYLHVIIPHHHSAPTCGSCGSLSCYVGAMSKHRHLLPRGCCPCTSAPASDTPSGGRAYFSRWRWCTPAETNWGEKKIHRQRD